MRSSPLRLAALVFLVGFAACSDDSAPASTAPTQIGAEGGLLDLGSGVTLQIPAGALSAPTEISARFDASGSGVSDEFRTGAVLVLEPAGLSFAIPARLSFSAEGVSGEPGELLALTLSASGALQLLPSSTVGSNGSVSGSVSRLAPVWISRRGQRAAAFEVSLPSTSLRSGDRVTLQVRAQNLAGDPVASSSFGESLTLTSSDSTVVAVDQGTLHALKIGTATITATLHGLTATLDLEVIEGVLARLEIRPSELTIARRDSATLGIDGFDAGGNPVAVPAPGPDGLRWTTSDASVVRVSESGVALAITSGSAEVRAKVLNVEASAAVAVPAPIPSELRIVSRSPEVRIDETRRISAQTFDELNEVMRDGVPEITWVIRDTTIARLSVTSDAGTAGQAAQIEGLTLGTTWIVARSEAGTDSVQLSVTPGTPAQLAFITEPSASTVAGVAFAQQPVVEIQDAQGNRVTTATDNVTLALTTGTGTLSGTTTVAAVDGVATFSGLSIDRVGTNKVLTASSGSLTTATTGALAITAGVASAAQSTLGVSPTSVVADGTSAATLTLTAKDAQGNVVSGASVFFATDLGTLSTGPWTTNASGVATATLTSTTTGSATLSAYLGTDATGAAVGTGTVSFTPGAAAQLAFITEPSASTVAGTAFAQQPVVEIQDAQGNRVTSATDNVTLALTTGTGTLSGTTTVAAVAGVATFSGLSIDLVGTDKVLTATAAGLTSATTFNDFTITAGAPSAGQSTFSVSATSVQADGMAFSTLTVTAKDAFGNLVSGAPVFFTTDFGTLSPGPWTTDAGGQASAVVVSTVTGTASLSGYLGSSATGTAIGTASVNFVPGAATQLFFTTQPSANTVAGTAFAQQPVVEIQDAQGNRVTSATDNVTLALTTGTGTLSGTTTVAAVAGVATFSGLSIDLVGADKVLTATSGSLASAVTSAFEITPGTATQLSFSTEPTASSEAGVAFAQQPVVEITDALGNLVTSATDNVTLALTTGTGTLSGTASVTAVAGVATFSGLSIDLVGADKVLTATSGSLASAVTSAFEITPGTATQLAFVTEPTAFTAANASFAQQPVVEMLDAYGNRVTTATDNVTLSLTSGSGTLSGTTTVAAVNGVATFSGLRVDQIGTGKQLSASATNVASATSTSFAVTNGLQIQDSHSCGIANDGSAWCWGDNSNGKLGNGSTTNSITASEVAGDLTFIQIVPGPDHSCGITTAGTAWCWGYNFQGQLGDGTTTNSTVPVRVQGSHTFVQLSAAKYSTCGLDTNGKVWCWGSNAFQQLGTGGSSTTQPTEVPVAAQFAQLSASPYHTCALTTGGKIWCWGNNSSGELGIGSASSSEPPTEIPSLQTFTQVSVGEAYSCAIDSANDVWCWGRNWSGQIGDGTKADKYAPTNVGSGFINVDAGFSHTCAIKTNREVSCWGSNTSGRLGDGSGSDQLTPGTIIANVGAVAQLSVGDLTSCVVDTAGTGWCWGSNTRAQMGLSDTSPKATPVQITNWPR